MGFVFSIVFAVFMAAALVWLGSFMVRRWPRARVRIIEVCRRRTKSNGKTTGRVVGGVRRSPRIGLKEYGKVHLATTADAPRMEGANGEKLDFKDFRAGTIVFGQPGTGKTRRLLSQVIRSFFRGSNLVSEEDRNRLKFSGFILDPKAEFVRFTWTLAKEYGREDDIIFVGPGHRHAIDPFGDEFESATQRADKMLAVVKADPSAPKGNADPFWDKSASKLFLNLFQLHREVRRRNPETAPPMSFSYLNDLVMDRGKPFNATEIASHEARKTASLASFDEACRSLYGIVIDLVPDLEGASLRARQRVSELQVDRAASAEIKKSAQKALNGLVEFLKPIESDRQENIEGKEISLQVEGDRLILQLQHIGFAASQFHLYRDENERLRFENTLVRAGPELRDILFASLGSLDLAAVGERTYQNLKQFCVKYEELLVAYDTLAKLIISAPKAESGKLVELLETYRGMVEGEGRKAHQDPVYNFFRSEYHNEANEKTAGSIAMCCSNVCNNLIMPPFNEIFIPGGDWNWTKVIDEGKIVVLDMNHARHGIGAMFTSILLKVDAFRTCLSRREIRVPDRASGKPRPINLDREFLYLVDELQVAVTTGVTTGEANFLDKCREYHGCAVLATQGLAMLLKAIAKEDMDAILTCAQMKFCFTSGDPHTMEYMSKISGEKYQVSGGFQHDFDFKSVGANRPASGSGPMQVSERPLIKPSEVAGLGVGECIVKTPSRFGRKAAFLKTTLTLDLLVDRNPEIPLPDEAARISG